MNVAVQKHKPIVIAISIYMEKLDSLELLFKNYPESLKNEVCFILAINHVTNSNKIILDKIRNNVPFVFQIATKQTKLVAGTIYLYYLQKEIEIEDGEIKILKKYEELRYSKIEENLFDVISKQYKEKSILINFLNNKNTNQNDFSIIFNKSNKLNSSSINKEIEYNQLETIGEFIVERLNAKKIESNVALTNLLSKENGIIFLLIGSNFEILETLGNTEEILDLEQSQNNQNLLISIKNSLLIETKNLVLKTLKTNSKQFCSLEDLTNHNNNSTFYLSCEIFNDEETEPLQKLVLLKFENVSEKTINQKLLNNQGVQKLESEFKQEEQTNLIEELKKINSELIEERNQFEMLISGSRLGTWDWNLIKDEITLNERWFEILGVIQKQIKFTFKNWKKFVLKEDQWLIKNAFNKLITGEQTFYDIEYRTIGLNGKIIWIHSTGKVITKNKKPYRIVGTHLDITEKKETESKIKIIEDRNKAIVSTLNEGVVIQNLDGLIISCNSSAERLLGLSYEQMIGKSPIDPIWKTIKEDGSLFSGDEHPAMMAIKTGLAQSDIVMGVIKPNGELTWINVCAQLLYHTDSKIPNSVFTTFYDFTARKKTEEELEKNKNLLAETGRVAQIGGWEFDLKSNQITWTEETFRIHEYDGNTPPSLEILKSFFDENYLPILDNAFKLAIEKGISFDLELKLRTLKKNEKWVRIIGKGKYENEGITKILGSIQDISKLKKQELELQSEKTRLNGIIEGTNVGTWEWNVKYNTTIFNDRWASMLGYTLEELAPISFQTWIDLAHPNDLISANSLIQKHLQKEIDYYELEMRMRHKNGQWKWILTRGKVVKLDEKNEPLHLSGIHIDITQSKLLEEELKRLSLVAERTSNAVVVSDNLGRITWVNESFTKITGYVLEEVKGKKPKSLFHYKGTNPDTIKYLHEKLKKLENAKCEIKNRGKFGQEYWIDLEIKPLFDQTGTHTGFMSVQTDITVNRESQKVLKQKNEQLENINKELEQFVYIASHDLQEPLLTIRNCAEIIKSEMAVNLDEEMNMYLDFIFQSSERLRELIKGLMQYSRIGRERRIEEIDLDNLLIEIKKDLQFSIEESSSIIKFDSLPKVNAYPTEIRLLFQNLISNSIKFRNQKTQSTIEINGIESDENWTFSVEDNGIGVETKNLEKVFVIFKRLHNRDEFEGTGIGLAHCKKIIDLHGGKIWMESEKGRGCKVIFTIPKNQ